MLHIGRIAHAAVFQPKDMRPALKGVGQLSLDGSIHGHVNVDQGARQDELPERVLILREPDCVLFAVVRRLEVAKPSRVGGLKKAYVRKVDVDYYTDAELAVRIGVHGVKGRTTGTVPTVRCRHLPSDDFQENQVRHPRECRLGQDRPRRRHHAHQVLLALAASFIHDMRPTAEMESGLDRSGQRPRQPCSPLPDVRSARFAGLVGDTGPITEVATIFLYDSDTGGVGFSSRLYEMHDTLLRGAESGWFPPVPALSGCPSCVGPQFEGG